MKRCLILSYGPVPVPEHTQVEGGGLRCWGLARGLRAHGADLDITVAYKDDYRKGRRFTKKHEGINVVTWNISQLGDLIADYDTVIVSYCMGELSNETAKLVRPDQQLVLDCYVPIYVEISARESDDLAGEYAAFRSEYHNWAKVLQRGDLFLCANQNQKRYYQGVLSALGRINPATYGEELILVVPYGIYRDKPKLTNKPITKLLGGSAGKKQEAKRLLWFGAIYPWFDLRELVDAVNIINKEVPTKLIIVGAKNPFNAHPDFIRRYDELMEHIQKSPESQKNIAVQEWVEFSDRANWYLESDLVILINKIGDENELSWRTRLVDFMWADLPIVTNGGDPLSEQLIAHNGASRLAYADARGMAKELAGLLKNDSRIQELKKNIGKQREQFYWDVVTKPLHDHILKHSRPRDMQEFGLLELLDTAGGRPRSLPQKIAGKAKKIPAYYKKHGARSTYFALRTTVLNQKKRFGFKEDGGAARIVFVSHQLDNTGGPHVLIDLIAQFRKTYPRLPFALHTFTPANSNNIIELNRHGVKPYVHLIKDIGLEFNKGDVVVLNTLAYSETFRNALYNSLKKGTVKKVIWYIHEDEPEFIFSKHEKKEIKHWLKAGKIAIYTPAIQSTKNYQEYFEDKKHIQIQYYRLRLPAEQHRTLEAKDFNTLNFILPGMVGDGRKGQLPIFYALSAFRRDFYDKAPDNYRNFSLTFIGMMDDFYSRQILKHYERTLDGHFHHYRQLNHEKTLELIKAANVTLCYSLRECLPIFVFEGMAAGHPILRNDCSGSIEQLHEGKNGYALDSNDFYQVVLTLEKILNKKKTTNAQLAAMSKESRKIVAAHEKQNFDALLSTIELAFTTDKDVVVKK